MRIELLLLGGILGALVFGPAGYIIRVWLSKAAPESSRSPCVDEIYNFLDGLRQDVDSLRSGVGRLPESLQLVESQMRLFQTEMTDFFDKTRKSEERARGHARRAEAAEGDEDDTEMMDEQLEALMLGQQGEHPTGESVPPMTRSDYYKQQGQ